MTNHKKVITSEVPKLWTFWDYVSPGQSNLVQEWVDTLSDEARLQFHKLLKLNQKIELPIHWLGRGKHFFLEGEGKDARIWELRFNDNDNVQYRILGTFWPKNLPRQATLLLGCNHKGKVYDPPNSLKSAVDRRDKIIDGTATRHERKITNEY